MQGSGSPVAMMARSLWRAACAALCVAFAAPLAMAAPYAAMIMDARTGEVLHEANADTRLHPASLTKMMTLYVAFDAIRRGEITLDTPVRISAKAAAEPPSKLGLKAGQTITMRHLIRAASIRSANDAATAIGEAISGSEAAFAERMNRTARALGMTRTTFRNAHGLTQEGHLSTARDMTVMGRRLMMDFPQYYNLFSRQTADAGIATVRNTNWRLLNSYRGADGIKTGYTRAAGFNLVASAERGQVRVIATVFGGRSVATRNARIAELLDMGFNKAPASARIVRPAAPVLGDQPGQTAVLTSRRPAPRPSVPAPALVAIAEGINAVVEARATETALVEPEGDAAGGAVVVVAAAPPPAPRQALPEEPEGPIVVTRVSSSGDRYFAISIGRWTTRHQAERSLLQVALMEMDTLDGALRKVVERGGRFEGNFVGLTATQAERACLRLRARNTTCELRSPQG